MSKIVTIPTDGGNPFVVILGGVKYVYKPGETVEVPDGVALEIEEWERWHEKYYGDNVPPFGAQPDWNQNDPNAPDYVKNRPFYDARDKVEYTFDGNVAGKETLIAPFDENVYLVKVADEIPTMQISEVSVCWSTPFGLEEASGFVNDAIVEEETGVYAILGAAYYFSENAEVPFSKGLYLMGSKNEEDKWWVSKISFTLYGDVKKLDTKYLPDGIGSLVITTYPEEREILHFPHGLYEMLRESWNKRMAVDIKVYSFNDPYANNVYMVPHEIDSYQYEAAEDRFEIYFNNVQNAIYVNADGTVEYIILD